MPDLHSHSNPSNGMSAFTLVEMLVVIAIMSVLMTVGSIGLSSMSGKGVTSGVANAEAIFDEARTTAVGRSLRSCVLVAKTLTNNPADDLRRMVVAYEEIDPATSLAKDPTNPDPNWELSSRGAVLPDQVFFSQNFSKKDHATGADPVPTIDSAKILNVKTSFAGSYFIYQFNSEGICSTPGASFIIGNGARNTTKAAIIPNLPHLTSAGKRDFGGFVIWRNGRTAMFRSPDQMGSTIKDLNPGDTF